MKSTTEDNCYLESADGRRFSLELEVQANTSNKMQAGWETISSATDCVAGDSND